VIIRGQDLGLSRPVSRDSLALFLTPRQRTEPTRRSRTVSTDLRRSLNQRRSSKTREPTTLDRHHPTVRTQSVIPGHRAKRPVVVNPAPERSWGLGLCQDEKFVFFLPLPCRRIVDPATIPSDPSGVVFRVEIYVQNS
jgi:hypothetical protein